MSSLASELEAIKKAKEEAELKKAKEEAERLLEARLQKVKEEFQTALSQAPTTESKGKLEVEGSYKEAFDKVNDLLKLEKITKKNRHTLSMESYIPQEPSTWSLINI